MPDPVVLFAMIVVLLPMGYFLLAAPAFLLVSLDIEAVARLLRVMFNGYFLTMISADMIGILAFVLDGRFVVAMVFALVLAFAFAARRWFLQRMDAQIRARDAGDADAARQLRRLHWGGMLSNAVELAAIVACIPYITVATT
ncbi:MAG TPA: hypothetical protein VIQ05_04290 [Tardiphaga sp.]